ncbi:zinc finger protein ush isoform X2 [Drosophila subpulchrella]|uniref:zinc finger protein ush isoform X2 n=1 Tax=Drosophila subpulchrella TaxID=1486046 RepID=UPI0018A1468B|nr:zinc finger protein ush isoform X2 [Drosophila subpulchrella]
MSRRKQSNPKPLNKGDCSDTTEEMTVDSRDSKDLAAQEMGEEKQQQMEDQLEDQMEDSRDPQENNNNNIDDDDEDGAFEQPEETNPEQDLDLGETEMEQDHDLQPEEQIELPANSPSTPPRSPSSPQLIPKLEQPATPPSEAEPSPCPSPCPPTPTPKFPKVRLNALLASDPALKPDAKELTLPDSRLLAPPPLVKPETQAQPEEPHLKPARFMCLPCGIAFSSPSTLEAHQAYYCSHRIKETEEAGSDKSGAGGSAATSGEVGLSGGSTEPPAKMARTGKQYGCSQCSYSADKKVSLNRHMRMHQTSPAAPTLASLPSLLQNGIPPPGVTPSSLEDSSSQQTDRYCSHCDIRFNNIKTYRAHKQHYCSSRRPEGQLTPKPDASPGAGSVGPGSSGPGGSGGVSAQAAAPGKLSPQARNKTPTPAMVAVAAAAAAAAASLQATPHSHPPFLALPTHPIIIVPCSLIRAASFIPGPLPTPNSGIVNPETTCFTVDNGTIKPLATALIGASLEPERPSAPSSAAEATEPKSSPPEPKRKEAGGSRESAPLDLSLRRSPISLNSLALRQRQLRNALLDVEEVLLAGGGVSVKDNAETPRGGGSVTPEQIVCAPSLPSSPSMSPSPKRRAISPRSSGAGSASSMSPPGLNVAVPHMLDMRSMLPADFGLSESLLAKTNPELALKLAAAAAAAAVAGSSGAAAFPPSPLPAQTSGGNPGGGGAAGGAQQPQIYVKKGVSKCMECNIVFCKYENYLAHKQHYCSARSQEGTGEVDVKSAVSPSNPGAGGLGAGGSEAASSVETTPVAYQQLICAACGIKYTSLDNLRAHQNYYCPKGGAAAAPAATPSDPGQLALVKEKCGKCKTLHEIGLPCPPPVTSPLAAPTTNSQPASNSLNKCPVCGVVSPTAAMAKKHMEMHGTVKAYRCSICQYKGNTLRGMRTHIRTHFDKKTSDVNEEHYMTCIFEEEGSTLTQELSPAPGAPATVAHDSMDHPSQMFNCDYCNYASTYKGNVLRHMKLLHPHVPINSPSISPDTRDQDVTSNPTPNQHSNSDGSNGEAASFHIKSEPLDNPPTLSLVHENNNSPISTPHIKAEPMEIGTDVAPGGLVPPMASPLGNSSVAATAAAVAAAEVMKKYCSTCDISFQYVKTYLAHKQFYCKNKPIRPEASDSPSPNHLGGGVAVGLGIGGIVAGHGQQKNKENLQEAAI